MYNYKIIYDCSHIQKLPNLIKNPDKKFLNIINKYNKSDKCIELLYDLKDGTLSEILDKLDQKEIYSLVVQLLYAIYQMNKRGFYHLDIHSRNVAYTKTNKTTIKIFGQKIPTHGYSSLIFYKNLVFIEN